MPWEYLQLEQLDCRFLASAGYLADKIEGKNILDLNCGTARLLLYLPKNFNNYFCNDINYQPITQGLKIQYFKETDVQMCETVKSEDIDVLCIFGHGGGDKLPSCHESPTLSASTIRIIKEHQPQIVVLEACFHYVHDKKVLGEILDECLKDKVYSIKQNILVKPVGVYKPAYKRNLIILES